MKKLSTAAMAKVTNTTMAEEQEALAYLKHPDLIDNLLRDITFVSQVVGEMINQMLMYMSYTSRMFDKPFSFIVTGQSGSGKTNQVKGVLKSIPPEDINTFSSVTPRSFDYCTEEELKHKVVFIEELVGAKDALPTIRLLQSEGRLCRSNTIRDKETNMLKTVSTELIVPCVVVTTSTIDRLNDENSSRIFELTTNDSIEQTKSIVSSTKEKYTLDGLVKAAAIALRERQMHNLQRMLEPIKVIIPYATMLRLPDMTSRNRRDSERFLMLITAFAFIRQYQKKRENFEGVDYIEADYLDYEYAYRYGKDILQNTVAELSERCWNVLNVICRFHKKVTDRNPGIDPQFTLKSIQEYANMIGIDLSNKTNLRLICKSLADEEFITTVQGGQGKTAIYSLNYNYKLDEQGEVDVTWRGRALSLTSPEELKAELEYQQ